MRKWRRDHGRPAQSVSEARAAVRGRPETDWYRVFKRDDGIDVLARAVRSGAAHDGATEEMTGCAESGPGAASIGADVEMMSGKVCRPSRPSVPYKSHMRRCSSTSSDPHIVHITPHTCHDTAARRGTSGTGDTSTTSHACTQTGCRGGGSGCRSGGGAADGGKAAEGGQMASWKHESTCTRGVRGGGLRG